MGREKIAELYYRSNSIKFGSFDLSAHLDNPDLPKSPWYLHYPKPGERGAELLPVLFGLIGVEFKNINDQHHPRISPKKIAAVPKGANPLGDSLARQYPAQYPNNLIIFKKETNPKTQFDLSDGSFSEGDELEVVEDHISGARNNRLFKTAAEALGLSVKWVLCVVDREQGGVANLATEGAEMLSIFTATELLEYGVAERHITQTRADEVNDYRASNQL